MRSRTAWCAGEAFTLIELLVAKPAIAGSAAVRSATATARAIRSVFTLIELLVVVAIIAILAAMLLPVLSQAREKAFLTTGRNNQRQILIATDLFQDDHEHYPYPYNGISAGLEMPSPIESAFADCYDGNGVGVANALVAGGDGWRLYGDELIGAGYLSTTAIFSDPGLTQTIKAGADWTLSKYSAGAPYVFGKAQITYKTNNFLWGSSLLDGWGYGSPRWKPCNDPTNAAQLAASYNNLKQAMLHSPDENMWIGDQSFTDVDYGCRPSWDGDSRRTRGKIMGFFDGHVEYVKREEWYSTTYWGAYSPASESPQFRARLWDIIHAKSLGGIYQNMDRNNYP